MISITKACHFCGSYNLHSFINSKSKGKEYESRITVALVNGTYRKGRKTIQGRTVDFDQKGRGFELNYCPTCGKKLRGEENEHSTSNI